MFFSRQVSHFASIQLSMSLNWVMTSKKAHPRIKAESWHINLRVSVSFQIQFFWCAAPNPVSDSEAEHWQGVTAGPPLHRLLRQSQYQGLRAHVVTWLLDTCRAPVLLRLNCLHEPVKPPAAAPRCHQFIPEVSLSRKQLTRKLYNNCSLNVLIYRLYFTGKKAKLSLYKNAIEPNHTNNM